MRNTMLHLRLWRALNPARHRWVPRSFWWALRPDLGIFAGHTGTVDGAVSFRFRNGDTAGLNANTDWKAAESVDISWLTTELDTTRRVRIEVDENKGVAETFTPQWQYSKNSGTWTNITTTSSNIKAVVSAQYNEGDATSTSLLTGNSRTHVNGEGTEDGASSSQTLNDQSSEYELAYQIVSTDVAATDTIDIRVNVGGTGVYTDPARITITAPPATVTQEAFRIRLDGAGLNTNSDWQAAQNVDASLEAEQTIRIRFRLAIATSNLTDGYQLRYSRNSGAYTALPVQATPINSGITPETVESTPSDQFTDDASITSALLTGGSGTFTNGRGDAASNVTSAITVNSGNHTEVEFAIRIRKFYWTGTEVAENTDGTTFDFRVYLDDGTALDTYSQTPRVTVDSNGLVGGCWPEGPGNHVPIVDGNGNLYVFMEAWELKTNGGDIVALKSTDGGVTWAAQDLGTSSAPTGGDADMESAAVLQDAGTTGRVLLFTHHGTSVDMHEFFTSDHATTPDDWGTINSLVESFTDAPNSMQHVWAHQRADNDIIVGYNYGQTASQLGVRYRISVNGGSSWGTAVNLDGTGTNHIYSAFAAMDDADVLHIMYMVETGAIGDDTAHVYYKTLNGSDTLTADGSRTQISSATIKSGPGERTAILGTVWYDDGGVDVVMTAWADGATGRAYSRALRDGTLQTIATNASDNVVATGGSSGSNAYVGDLVVNAAAKDVYLFYSTPDATPTSLYYDTNTDEGGWGTDTLAKSVNARWVRGAVYTRSGSKLGYLYDDGTGDGGGGQGPVYFDELDVTSVIDELGAGSANSANQATATGAVRRDGASSANQATDTTGSGSRIVIAAGSANQASSASGVGAKVKEGAGSANQANQATAVATVTRSSSGSANNANQATANAACIVNAAGVASQANDTSSLAHVDRLASGSADQASTVTANGTIAAAVEGAGSADNASESTAAASILRSGQASANNANQAVGTAIAGAAELAAGSANQAVEAVGNAAVVRQASGSANNANNLAAEGQVAGIQEGVGSADNAVDASGSAFVLKQAAATANQAADATATSTAKRLAQASANQAAAATATGEVFGSDLAAGTANNAVDAVGSAAVNYQASGSANQANAVTAAGAISGLAEGDGSANTANDATGTAHIDRAAAATASQAVDATAIAARGRAATASANQSATAIATAVRTVTAAATANTASDTAGLASLDVSAAGSADQASAMSAAGELVGSATGEGSANNANTASATAQLSTTSSATANIAIDATATPVVDRTGAGSANNANQATANGVAGAFIDGAGSANQASTASGTASVIRLGSGNAPIAVAVTSNGLKELFGAAIAATAAQTIGQATLELGGIGTANNAQDATGQGFLVGDVAAAGVIANAAYATAGGFSSPAVTGIDGTRVYNATTRTYDYNERSYRSPDQSDTINPGEPEFV